MTLVGKVRGLVIETQGIALERGDRCYDPSAEFIELKIVYGRVLDANALKFARGGTP